MLTTTRRGVQYPNPDRSDRDDIATHIGYIAAAVDVDVLFTQGTDAVRQGAAHQAQGGLFFWCTDTKLMWYDDGTTWQMVGTISLSGVNTQTITNYTLVASDNNKLIEMNNGGANTVTIPTDATAALPIGANIEIAQLGGGQTGLAPMSGVTLRSYNNNLHIAGQYGVAAVIKRAANDWYAAGNLVP